MASASNAAVQRLQDRALNAQTSAYVQNQKRADFNRNVAQYMFWGATSISAGLIAGMVTGASMAFLGTFTVPIMAAVAGATFLGSLSFSRRATEIQEKGAVLFSDIDSRHQAHRMVQAFAQAQTQGQVATDDTTPMTSKNWANRVGGPKQPEGNWQERVAAQALREDVQTIRQLG